MDRLDDNIEEYVAWLQKKDLPDLTETLKDLDNYTPPADEVERDLVMLEVAKWGVKEGPLAFFDTIDRLCKGEAWGMEATNYYWALGGSIKELASAIRKEADCDVTFKLLKTIAEYTDTAINSAWEERTAWINAEIERRARLMGVEPE